MSESAIVSIVIAIALIVIGLIRYFLQKIHQSFEETQKDVKQLLINGGKRDAQLNELQSDIYTLSMKTDKHDDRLQKVELQIGKLIK